MPDSGKNCIVYWKIDGIPHRLIHTRSRTRTSKWKRAMENIACQKWFDQNVHECDPFHFDSTKNRFFGTWKRHFSSNYFSLVRVHSITFFASLSSSLFVFVRSFAVYLIFVRVKHLCGSKWNNKQHQISVSYAQARQIKSKTKDDTCMEET